MRIGIISDIHGNIDALDAVLNELKTKNVDKIICLGDLIGGAPMSDEVIKRIMKIRENIIVVMGNREKYIIEGMPDVVHDEKMKVSEEQKERNEWVKNSLSKESIEFINKMPKEVIYNVGKKKIYIAHYPMDKQGKYRRHIKHANAEENEEMFSEIDADIYLYGHTHSDVYNLKNGKIYINPGTVGCPKNTNYAKYGILNIEEENVNYEQLYTEYDVKKVIREIEKIKFIGYKNVLKLFYGFKED